ncbi:hypothetical protein NXF25_008286 [Crotalus adamanteus]|uniref:Uncharacterized protein n=1 Tax=Crotalus adamanteus TaxID=8729 RepID=A0AAW1BMW1_CROAD
MSSKSTMQKLLLLPNQWIKSCSLCRQVS